jgi:hypothetical protein
MLTPALAGLSGCGDERDGAAEATDQALTIPPSPIPILDQCLAKPADATGTRRTFTTVHAPTKYGTTGCPKAYVVDALPQATNTSDLTSWNGRTCGTATRCNAPAASSS